MAPRRHTLKPILVYCEGLHDKIFVRHLERLYRTVDSGFFFDIKQGTGGSPKSLVEKAAKIPASYDRRVVIFDNDRGEDELLAAQEAATYSGIGIYCLTPCLEAIMLTVLDSSRDYTRWSTARCKRHFHRTYLNEHKRLDISEYRIFSKSAIKRVEASNGELERIIALLTE